MDSMRVTSSSILLMSSTLAYASKAISSLLKNEKNKFLSPDYLPTFSAGRNGCPNPPTTFKGESLGRSDSLSM